MEIIIAKEIGFCNGVLKAITECQRCLKDSRVYVKGDIVHNKDVIDRLKQDGLIMVNDFENLKENSKVIIRTHGEEKSTYENLKNRKMQIIDLTCVKVKAIHDLIKKHNDSYIVIIGKKGHPEVWGHISYAKNSFVVEEERDIKLLLDEIVKLKVKQLIIVAQTTFNDELYDKLVDIIRKECQKVEIKTYKTICNVTKTRQKEIKDLANKVDKMIIVGDKSSSNTKELVQVAKENCREVYLVQNIDDLKDIIINEKDIIGIGSGASTPIEIITDMKKYLQSRIKEL